SDHRADRQPDLVEDRRSKSRYSSYRRSPRRYKSPPRGRTPPSEFDIGAGEAGLAVQCAIAAVVIAGAGALFVVDRRLRGIEVHHVVKGEGPRLQGAEADLSRGLHGIHNLQGIQTKATQGHHLEVPHGRQVWSHMEMAQPILDGIDDRAVVVEAAGVASQSIA
ncbi:hypothetical protein Sango_2231500, partial [Sesamum angolense]